MTIFLLAFGTVDVLVEPNFQWANGCPNIENLAVKSCEKIELKLFGRSAIMTRMSKSPPVVIGDVHGCYHELLELLDLLSRDKYAKDAEILMCGDLVDRGPFSGEVVREVRARGLRCVMGNHDRKHPQYRRHLDQAAQNPRYKNPMRDFRHQVEHAQVLSVDSTLVDFMATLPTRINLPEHNAVVVHAGLGSHADDRFCQHVRFVNPETGVMMSLLPDLSQPPGSVHWTERYTGSETVYFGHDVMSLTEPLFLTTQGGAKAVALDTGCVYGGRLTAVQVGTMRVFQVPSQQPYVGYKLKRLGGPSTEK